LRRGCARCRRNVAGRSLGRLRWWAVGAQAGVLAAATLGLDVDLPLPALAGVVGAVAPRRNAGR
jgi:hypothetical protein